MSARLHIALAAIAIGALAFACTRASEGEDEDVGEDALSSGEAPRLGARIDRIGRPEVTNFLVRVPALKEGYNADDSFAVSAENKAKYEAMFKTSLAMYDAYDTVTDMDEEMRGKLAAILVDDTLHIDLSKPCSGVSSTGYFDLERAQLLGKAAPSPSCGGRSPNEDAFDTLATLFTNGPAKLTPRVTDLVDTSTGVANTTFPYLVKPHLFRQPPPPTPTPTADAGPDGAPTP